MWFNPIVKTILRSPLHGMVSKNMMLLMYTGRKSGREYMTPVNYVRDGDTLYTTSSKDRTWWRNFRGGAPVSILLQGKNVGAEGEVAESGDNLTAWLARLVQLSPRHAKYYGVAFDGSGQPNPDDIHRKAEELVCVRFKLG
jgi:deazaflavin-dependent oxidoreductase (nitroreductase family)